MYKYIITINIFILLFINFSNINSQTLIYFDPDGNLRRIIDINAEGNKIFGNIGIKFLVAADENSFNNAIKLHKPEFYILNSLIYQNYKKSLNLDVGLIFEKNKNHSYKKKLVTYQENLFLTNIKDKIIASSFKDIFEIVPIESKILKVPKDLDALLAIKFKQSDIALVSESSLEIFKNISPVDFNQLKIIFTSKEIYNPFFCYVQGSTYSTKIKDIESLLQSSEAKNFLNLLMFDSISSDPKILSKIK